MTGIRRTAYLLCGDWHRAEDIAQTALAKLYVAWPRLNRDGLVDAYTRKIVVRAAINRRATLTQRSDGSVQRTQAADGTHVTIVTSNISMRAEVEGRTQATRATPPLSVDDMARIAMKTWLRW